MGALDRVFRSRRPSQQGPLAAIIAGQWRAGEQGIQLDSSDLSTMFQDAAGTLPVYAPGQGQVDPPVGLWLDRRMGLTRGAEVWSDASAMLSGSASRVSAGIYRIYTPDGSVSSVYHPVVSGRWYALSFRVVSVAVASVGLYAGPSASNAVFPSGTMVPGRTLTAVLYANSGSLAIARNASTTDVTIDSVSIRELSGNHAYQVSTPSRPTLSARYNSLLASAKFDDLYWGMTSHFAIAQTADVPDSAGGAAAWKLTSTTAASALVKSLGSGFTKPVLTVWCRAGSYTPSIALRNQTAGVVLLSGTAATASFSNGYGVFTNTDLGGGWRKIRLEITSGLASSETLFLYYGSLGAIPVGQFFYLEKIDVREAGNGVRLPEYQRVLDPSVYDTWGFPPYVRFDGVDDFMQTSSIDFSGTNAVTFSAAYRKLSDAAIGEIFSLSTSPVTNTGTFGLYVPDTAGGTAACVLYARGTVTESKTAAGAAPISCVVTAQALLNVPLLSLRFNGGDKTLSTSAMGGGNFGNYPLYIGRRGGAGLPFNGCLYALLIRGAATPDATATKVERYINEKARVF